MPEKKRGYWVYGAFLIPRISRTDRKQNSFDHPPASPRSSARFVSSTRPELGLWFEPRSSRQPLQPTGENTPLGLHRSRPAGL